MFKKVKIYIAGNPQEADFMKSLLEQSSIIAEVRGLGLQGLGGEIPVSESYPTLWVSEDLAEKSLEIVKKYEANSFEKKEDWVCSNCNEEVEGQFTHCWNCQTEFGNM